MPVLEPRNTLLKGFGFSAVNAVKYFTASTYSLFRVCPPVWGLLNKSGKQLHMEHPPMLEPIQKRVVSDLMDYGIATIELQELCPGSTFVQEMLAYSNQYKNQSTVGERKKFLRFIMGDPSGGKTTIDLSNPAVPLSVDLRILDIVNSYMEACSKLIYFQLATTNVVPEQANPSGSQKWHRDPGMKRIVKMFVYLTDVDKNSGPFTYILRSHSRGHFRKIFPQKQFGRHGYYPPEGAVEKAVTQRDIKTCTGKAGTVIFCDTTGLHKGGFSIQKPRIMFTSVYVSEADVIKPMFSFSQEARQQITSLHPVSEFALR